MKGHKLERHQRHLSTSMRDNVEVGEGAREREYTHDGGHVVLGTRGDEHTEVRFAVVHA